MTLRAEAPSFLMPPPGLGPLCGDAAQVAHLALSPCSTAAPSPDFGATSPAFSGCLSPWAAPFEPGWSHLGSEDFGPLYLTESAFMDGEQAPVFSLVDEWDFKLPEPDINYVSTTEFNFSDWEFKISGMEDLQISVANLLANFATTPTTETGSTCSPGTEESSRPSTPEVDEVAPKKGWGQLAATEACKEMQLGETLQTTVMVQNVPKKCTRDQLAKTLDEAGFRGEYDFIYVTADLKQRNCGTGLVMVNFRSEEACTNFTAAFHKKGVAVAFTGFVGKKAIEVAPAPVQGLDANVRKLEKSGVLMSMLAERPGWRPARYNYAGQIEAEIGDC